MNLPNKLTLSRFVLTVAFLIVMFSQIHFHETIALFLFSAAGISDFLDGPIARRQKLITNFGILMYTFGLHFPGDKPWVDWFTEASKWVAVALTFVSGWLYLWKNRSVYLQDL